MLPGLKRGFLIQQNERENKKTIEPLKMQSCPAPKPEKTEMSLEKFKDLVRQHIAFLSEKTAEAVEKNGGNRDYETLLRYLAEASVGCEITKQITAAEKDNEKYSDVHSEMLLEHFGEEERRVFVEERETPDGLQYSIEELENFAEQIVSESVEQVLEKERRSPNFMLHVGNIGILINEEVKSNHENRRQMLKLLNESRAYECVLGRTVMKHVDRVTKIIKAKLKKEEMSKEEFIKLSTDINEKSYRQFFEKEGVSVTSKDTIYKMVEKERLKHKDIQKYTIAIMMNEEYFDIHKEISEKTFLSMLEEYRKKKHDVCKLAEVFERSAALAYEDIDSQKNSDFSAESIQRTIDSVQAQLEQSEEFRKFIAEKEKIFEFDAEELENMADYLVGNSSEAQNPQMSQSTFESLSENLIEECLKSTVQKSKNIVEINSKISESLLRSEIENHQSFESLENEIKQNLSYKMYFENYLKRSIWKIESEIKEERLCDKIRDKQDFKNACHDVITECLRSAVKKYKGYNSSMLPGELYGILSERLSTEQKWRTIRRIAEENPEFEKMYQKILKKNLREAQQKLYDEEKTNNSFGFPSSSGQLLQQSAIKFKNYPAEKTMGEKKKAEETFQKWLDLLSSSEEEEEEEDYGNNSSHQLEELEDFESSSEEEEAEEEEKPKECRKCSIAIEELFRTKKLMEKMEEKSRKVAKKLEKEKEKRRNTDEIREKLENAEKRVKNLEEKRNRDKKEKEQLKRKISVMEQHQKTNSEETEKWKERILRMYEEQGDELKKLKKQLGK